MNFYVGIFDPSTAWPFERCMISVNAVRDEAGQGRWFNSSHLHKLVKH